MQRVVPPVADHIGRLREAPLPGYAPKLNSPWWNPASHRER